MSEPENSGDSLVLERTPVEGSCPRCGAEELRRYPVIAETGWLEVVKCQNCLLSTERTPWNRLGPIQLLVDMI
ncbi:hypothetical protein FOS14_21410 [Skermania sp. ID1734]|uniref:hypothetical protein n=1 Tax=Skermania sp. ID1734 TaxID=2597516 RepID=UPI00117EFB33|nr:hypothetical protein [Skermania sp. ID1734]TSD94087.1 hypothetical protein FOS14_21410 [Skermania sp. ID1734]